MSARSDAVSDPAQARSVSAQVEAPYSHPDITTARRSTTETSVTSDMSMQSTSSSKQPLGGTRRRLRHRLFRFHLPLAVASSLVLVAFMTLPPFDPQTYPQESMGSAVLPQAVSEQPDGGEHGGSQTQDRQHGGDDSSSRDHSGEEATAGHGRDQGDTTDNSASSDQTGQHEGSQSQPEDSEDQTESSDSGRQRRFLISRLTTATGYIATVLLAATLLIGPANLLFDRRNPVSTYLRRDVGAWTAGFSIAHVIFGLQLHSGGSISLMLEYFVVDGRPLLNSFGLGNWTGLAATVVVTGLLVLSNDFALRKLKAKRWKTLQRFNYVLFALVVLHAFFYGALLRVTSPYTLLLILTVIAVLVGQAIGIRLWRKRQVRTAST